MYNILLKTILTYHHRRSPHLKYCKRLQRPLRPRQGQCHTFHKLFTYLHALTIYDHDVTKRATKPYGKVPICRRQNRRRRRASYWIRLSLLVGNVLNVLSRSRRDSPGKRRVKRRLSFFA